MTTQIPLTKVQKEALYIKFFEKLENPALVILGEDGKYRSQYNQLEISEEEIPHLGMGVMIQQEDLERYSWF